MMGTIAGGTCLHDAPRNKRGTGRFPRRTKKKKIRNTRTEKGDEDRTKGQKTRSYKKKQEQAQQQEHEETATNRRQAHNNIKNKYRTHKCT
jgi:hypothetical protein